MSKPTTSLRICIPDATQNYIQNPSVRFDTTGWAAFGSTISRTLDYARFGIASLKVITTGATLREGTYYRVNNLTGVNEPITVSAYVRGTGKVHIRLIDSPGGFEWTSKPIFLSAIRWQRIEVTGRCTGGNDVRLYVETDGNSVQATTFYVDGAQMERKAYSTTYCDGDQPGCRWNIIQSASMATRDAYTREGGKWVTLAGPEREEENLYMSVVGGLGMPPMVNNIQSFALAAGSYYQNTKVMDRVVTLTFHAKHKDLLGKDKLSLSYLHALRQSLIDTIKPDLTAGGQEFLMEYVDGDTPLYFRARYDGGLEGEWDVRNKWVNSFPLRLLIVSPMLQEDSQELKDLDFQDSFIVKDVTGRIDGKWSNLNFGFNDQTNAFAFGRKGEVYVAGKFTYVNNNASAISPNLPANRITYWDGSQFNLMGTGADNSIVDIAVAPNGYVYATGTFLNIGGVAANRIAYWNGSAWTAMGSGLNNTGWQLQIAPNGDVYVCGDFTTAGGSTANRIAKWNGSSWSTLGALNGLNGQCVAMAMSQDGLIMYVGGGFTDQFSLAANGLLYVAKYTVSTNIFSAVGSGFNAAVTELVLSPANILYAGGTFTASGTTSIARISQLMGSAWAPLGSGMNNTVWSMDVGVNGDLIAVGQFTTAGGITVKGIALWNGSSWVNVDIELSVGYGSTIPLAVQISPNGDIYFGGQNLSLGTYQSQVSGITLISNIGSAEVSPFIFISGQGTLKWVENQSTGKRMFFNLSILSGEEVFIDFGKGTIESTVRGSLLYSMLPGSDFSAFTLIPGDNKIAMLISQDVGAVAKIGYVPTHWSVDSSR